MNSITVRTTGFREADQLFRALPLKFKEKELRKGHRSAARILIQAEREGFARVAKNRTGATERSIGAINLRSTRRDEVGAVGVGPRRTRSRLTSGWKAHWFEFGTVKMRARPFITPAINRTKKQMEDIVGEKLALTLNRTIKRYRKI